MRTSAFLATVFALTLSGCGAVDSYVPKYYIGLVLKPTGYEERVYEPGTVNLDKAVQNDVASKLVIVRQSDYPFTYNEQFPENSSENNRCLVGPNKKTIPLDVHLSLKLP